MRKFTLGVFIIVILFAACSSDTQLERAFVPDYPITLRPEAALLVQHTKEVVVHRGANHLAPENTYAAAAKAIELGVDYVEIDVHRSLDGVHYIMHDLTLGRTTNGWGVIRLRNSAYLDGLDAGSWFSKEYIGEPIPRLEEYLRWIKGKAKVYLDVKTADLEKVVGIIRELDMENDVFFWFWSDAMVKEFRSLAPEMGLKVNASTADEVLKAQQAYGATIIECHVEQITPELLQACRSRGIRLMAYADTNTREEYEAVILSETDLVNLDRPQLYLQVLDSLNQVSSVKKRSL